MPILRLLLSCFFVFAAACHTGLNSQNADLAAPDLATAPVSSDLSSSDEGSQPDQPFGTCGRIVGLVCAEDHYCKFDATEMCGLADGSGTCMPRPGACTDQNDPVCGCDGKSYNNPCEARRAGTDVAHAQHC